MTYYYYYYVVTRTESTPKHVVCASQPKGHATYPTTHLPTPPTQGFTFESRDPTPTAPIPTCYVTAQAYTNRMDMSNANYCAGSASPSDCPFNLYRV